MNYFVKKELEKQFKGKFAENMHMENSIFKGKKLERHHISLIKMAFNSNSKTNSSISSRLIIKDKKSTPIKRKSTKSKTNLSLNSNYFLNSRICSTIDNKFDQSKVLSFDEEKYREDISIFIEEKNTEKNFDEEYESESDCSEHEIFDNDPLLFQGIDIYDWTFFKGKKMNLIDLFQCRYENYYEGDFLKPKESISRKNAIFQLLDVNLLNKRKGNFNSSDKNIDNNDNIEDNNKECFDWNHYLFDMYNKEKFIMIEEKLPKKECYNKFLNYWLDYDRKKEKREKMKNKVKRKGFIIKKCDSKIDFQRNILSQKNSEIKKKNNFAKIIIKTKIKVFKDKENTCKK